MKEYCILVVILAATLAHAQQVGMAEGKFMIPTIAYHDEDVLRVPENNHDSMV